MKTLTHYINGELTKHQGKAIAVENPATAEKVAEVALATVAETEQAIEAAQAAFPAWAATPANKRAQILFKFKFLLEENREAIAQLLTTEHGKTLEDARGEVARGIEVVDFVCGVPTLQKGEHSDCVSSSIDSWSMQQPLGVVAGITPFNFPAMVPMWMFPVAIACGNTFVLKPSEKDPSAPLKIAELLSVAGLPNGVFNVVNGDKTAVDVLLTHPTVQAVSFVGSTPVAEYIYETASKHGKRVQALGGAKNHLIVMPDADLEQATNAILGAAYGSAGERCMAVSVVVAVGQVANKLVDNLAEKVKALKVGNGIEPGMEMGPLSSKAHYEKVLGYIESGIEADATLVVDGRDVTVSGCEDGYFVGGCLFDNVTPEMTIYQEEIFGPVLCVVRAPDYQTAVKLINDHEYGNGAVICTRDGDCARQFANDVQAGMVGINVPIPVPMAFHSFGGWKRSMFGPLAVHGPDGVRFYTKRKTVTAQWPSGIRSNPDFVIPN